VLIQLGAVQAALRAVGQQALRCHLADAMGAVSTGQVADATAAEEAAYLAGLLSTTPHSGR